MSLFTETRTTTHLNREGHKRKNSPFIYILPALILSALLLSSCSFDGAGSNTTDGTSVPSGSSVVTVTGSLNPGGALPAEIAQFAQRTESSNITSTAFPSIPTTGITYTVTAVNTASGSTESYTGQAVSADGNLTYTVGIPATENEKNFKIQVSAVYDSKEILSGESAEFPISNTSPIATKDITLSATQSTGGTGNIELEINVSGTEITKCICNLSSTTFNVSDGKITVRRNLLDTTINSAIFSFYDNSDTLLYRFKETINIFDGLITNTWVQNGAEPWFVTTGTGASKTTSCRITSAMVEGFKLTDIYVDPTLTISGSGTFLNPVKSFNEALEKLLDATKDYTINIVNSSVLHSLANIVITPGVLKADGSGSSKAKTLAICGATGLDTNGNPQDCIDGSSNRQCVKLDTDVPVTLKNLEIMDGLQESGAGIYTKTNLVIDNCIISTCHAEAAGGGLCIDGNSETVMSGGIIKENSAVDTGGGVYIELNTSSTNRNFTMTGGEITGNSADYGGGVYAYADFSMSGGVISGNTASEYGGGVMVYNNSTFTMSGGTIRGNTSDNLGGAVYVYGTFKMKGSAYIPAGVDGVTGSGKNDVYLVDGKTIKIAGQLTPPAECTDGIVATITPSSYTAGTQLIELDTGVTDTSLAEAAAHFAVTPNAGTGWTLDSEGKLKALIGTKVKPDAVGDIVFNDGSAMPYSDYAAAATDVQNAKKPYAIALIFYKGTGLNSGDDTTTVRTLGVGLKHNKSGLAWCLESANGYSKDIATIKCKPDGSAPNLTFDSGWDKNGSNNLDQIADALGTENDDTGIAANYPAFYYGKNYKDITGSNVSGTDYEDGWYFPSLAELFYIYANGQGTSKIFDIEAASEALGGDKFGNSAYWSSSQHTSGNDLACSLTFPSGTWSGWYKRGDNYYVCAIREF